MRSMLLLGVVAALIVTSAAAQVPMGVIAEDATATWCGYCPYAYAGLEAMKAKYDATEFNAIRYYATSGGLGTTETQGRIAYYGVTGYPTVIFQGTQKLVGASSSYSNGSVYDPVVAGLIGIPSPIRIRVNSVDLVGPDGSIDVDVEIAETMPDIGNVKIRMAVMQNDVVFQSVTHTDVTRDMLADVALTVSQEGQVQNVVQPFAIDGAWVGGELWVMLWIQDDDTKEIVQSASTRPAPAYSIRYWSKGIKGVVVGARASHMFDEFAVFNYGTNPDVIRVALDGSTLPQGWSALFTDGVNQYTDYVDLALAPGESRVYRLQVDAGGTGYAHPSIRLTSANLPDAVRIVPYQVMTDDLEVLVVDDDGAEAYELYHTAALEAAGKTYGVWKTGIQAADASVLTEFDIVDWQIGLAYPTLDAADRAALSIYLDGGGNLFVTGQDLGWELNDEGGAALQWLHNYLHANYLADDTNSNTVHGVAGDPVGDGLVLSLAGGDGANNNIYPDHLGPYDGTATVMANYATNPLKGAALRVDTGVYKVVYLGFPYEAISTPADRALLMQRAMQWFGGPVDVDDAIAAGFGLEAFPNPASGSATLRFALPSAGSARLAIYAPDGRLVRTLLDGNRDAGVHTLSWDGRSDAGRPVPAGVYFYRLEADRQVPSGKLVLTR